jgi:transcriptional regulator with XRE-family HTH domain
MPDTFADKLNRLFRTIRKPDGEEYSPEEIQVATEKAITSSYIYRLRSGKSSNPTIDKVKALADFFGIEPGYFFTEDETDPVADTERLVANMALRARNLDMKTIEEMLLMIQEVRRESDQQYGKKADDAES